MKQDTKILIIAGVGAAVVSGLALAGYKYKQAAEALQFGMGGISPLGIDDNGLRVLINVKITNRSGFVFPVPQAFVKFNVAGKEVGAAQTTQWQTIGANAETVLPLVGYFRINELGGLITLLYNATTLPKEILYSGYVDFGKFQIPFNSSYAIGAKKNVVVDKVLKAINNVINGHTTQYINANGKVIRVSDHGANPQRVDENTFSIVIGKDWQSFRHDRNRPMTNWERTNQYYMNDSGGFTEQFESVEDFLQWFDII